MLRELGNRADVLITEDPCSGAALVRRMHNAARRGSPCARSYSYRLEATYQRKIGNLTAAQDAIHEAFVTSGGCLVCRADCLRRRSWISASRGLTSRDQTLLESAMSDAQASLAIYTRLLAVFPSFKDVFECCRGAALIAIGQFTDLLYRRTAPDRFREALSLTGTGRMRQP